MRPLPTVEQSHEELFAQRYESLVAWTMRLCRQERDRAEDLVHDAFIAFTLGRPDLAEIENLDGYLRGMLRKLHVSAVRRAARGPHASLTIVDHDSAELGLRAVGAAMIEAKYELACVCRYACARKESSKAGSILILRFFHGYFPTEIAQLVRCGVHAVDEWLRIARREAKRFRDAPDSMRFLAAGGTPPAVTLPSIDAGDPAEFLRGIRAAIFQARSGRCLTPHELRAFYDADVDNSMDAACLAHVVSCQRCLQRINAMLGLGSLDDRLPPDMLGPNRGGPGASLGIGRSSSEAGRRRGRRWRTVYEHHALELQIVVNGFLVGSHTVGRSVTRQTVAVTLDEPVGSVEVFGERGVRLAFLDVTPQPDGSVEQSVAVSLSDDRRLTVRISFARPWPEVDVEYEDPHRRDVPIAEEGREDLPPRVVVGTTPRRGDWRRWTSLPGARRWKLALVTGCVVLLMAFAPAGSTAWAAERLGQAIAAITRELREWSQRLRGSRPLVSRPLAMSIAPSPALAASHLVVPSSSARHTPVMAEAARLARAEMDALTRLDAIDALVGGQIDVRKEGRYVLVRGLVENDARKRVLLDALRTLERDGLVHVDVESVSEHLQRLGTTASVVTRYQPLEFDVESIPALPALRAGLTERSESATRDERLLEAEARRVATAALDSALDARLHAVVLRSLADRYDGDDLRRLSQSAYDRWRTLVATHANAFATAAKNARELLEPLLADTSTVRASGTWLGIDAASNAVVAREPVSMTAATRRITAAAVVLDETIRAGLSASSARPPSRMSLRDPRSGTSYAMPSSWRRNAFHSRRQRHSTFAADPLDYEKAQPSFARAAAIPACPKGGVVSKHQSVLTWGVCHVAIAALAVFAASSGTVGAQAANAILSGTIVDATGASVSDVAIVVLNVETSQIRQASTTSDGAFAVPLLPPGRYTLSARRAGFTPLEVPDIVLKEDDHVALRLELKLEGLSEAVVVSAQKRGEERLQRRAHSGRRAEATEPHNRGTRSPVGLLREGAEPEHRSQLYRRTAAVDSRDYHGKHQPVGERHHR